MARTYDITQLDPVDLTNLEWARAQTRLFLRDKPNEFDVWPDASLHDEEIDAYIALSRVVVEGTSYYLPHEAAARVLETNPEALKTYAGDGWTETFRDPGEVADDIRKAGKRFEAEIPTTEPEGAGTRHVSHTTSYAVY